MQFIDFGLKETTIKALTDIGFTQPTEIQAKAIPALLEGDIDFIGQAQTGTGKTAAFLLPLFEKLRPEAREVQALILAPTRELANQIEGEIVKFSSHEKVRSLSVYGGTPIGPQIKSLRSAHPAIVVGTPGRVQDLIDRGALDLSKVRYVILDEADEMLDMGFFDDVQSIIANAKEKKVWMFSATMPGPIKDLVAEHFHDPLLIKVTKQQLTTEAVKQTYLVAKPSHMVEALCRYLDSIEDIYGLVFTRTKIGAQQLADALNARGYPTEALHGDMEQEARDFTMRRFKDRLCKMVVCTDVAARGIDVSDLTHVINFELPLDLEAYVHRIGRTGRGGAKGVAMSLIGPDDFRKLSQIERITKAKIERVELPQVESIRQILLKKNVQRLQNLSTQTFEADSYLSEQMKMFIEELSLLSREDLERAIFSQFLRPILEKYRHAQEVKVERYKDGPQGQRSRSGSPEGGMGRERSSGSRGERFFVNLGKVDGVTPGELLRFIHNQTGVRGESIGRIDIREKFLFLEVKPQELDRFMDTKGKLWNNRKVNIEAAISSGPSSPRRGDGGRRRY